MIKIYNNADNYKIDIEGPILSDKWEDERATTPGDIKEVLNSINKNDFKPLILNINSEGGDVMAGTEIINLITEYKGTTTAIIQSMACSIASAIAFSCDNIKIYKNSYIMIHKPWGYLRGNSKELRKYAEFLDKIENNLIDIYMNKAKKGIERETIIDYLDNESWFSSSEALDVFNIEILEINKIFNYSNFKPTNKAAIELLAMIREQQEKEDIEKELIKIKLSIFE